MLCVSLLIGLDYSERMGWTVFWRYLYVYDIKTVIIWLIFVPFINCLLFSESIVAWFKRRWLKKANVETVKIPKYKIVLCVISVVILLSAFASVGSITVEEDSITIKETIFNQKQTVTYAELEHRKLFVADDNEVYWGLFTNDNSEYVDSEGRIPLSYNRKELYLGYADNNGRLIQLINEKSGRDLKVRP